MRVVVESVEDFLTCLPTEAGRLFEDTVRANVSQVKQNEMTANVYLQLSAVVQLEEGEYILECGVSCGQDYLDCNEKAGTAQAAALKQAVQNTLSQRGWKLKPGMIMH